MSAPLILPDRALSLRLVELGGNGNCGIDWTHARLLEKLRKDHFRGVTAERPANNLAGLRVSELIDARITDLDLKTDYLSGGRNAFVISLINVAHKRDIGQVRYTHTGYELSIC